MTDPLSKYWGQPSVEDILVDDTHAIMTKKTLEQLKDYSHSRPSGVYHGKMWRMKEIEYEEGSCPRLTGNWILCWYGPHSDPGYVSNNYRTILLID